MRSHLESLTKEQRLEIYNSINENLAKRGLDINEIRKITGITSNSNSHDGKFLNLVIKSTK